MTTLDELKASCRKLPQDVFVDAYVVPFDWHPGDDGTLFPLPQTYRWQTLETLARELDITQAILSTLPFIWQIELLVHKATRALSVPIAVTSPQNLPLVRPYLDEAGADLVLADPEHAEEVIALCEKATRPPKAILVIHKSTETIRQYRTDIRIVHELHLVPGLPLAYQNLARADKNNKEVVLDLVTGYDWHLPENPAESVCVSYADLPVPLNNLELSLQVTKDAKDNPVILVV